MKYFVVTDIHGYFDEMKDALTKAGYDIKNKKHFFISCGDLFDRGAQAKQCLEFVTSIPKTRRVFIEGNHETNFLNIKRYGDFDITDIWNSTIDTIEQLSNISQAQFNISQALNVIEKNEKVNEYFGNLKEYFKYKNIIFVHGWIPRIYDNDEDFDKYRFDWHGATHNEWNDARWMNGFEEWKNMQNLIVQNEMKQINKTIVCGHWNTSYAHAKFHNKGKDIKQTENPLDDCCFDPFVDEGIIGLDACTALSHQVNVMVIDEDGQIKYYSNKDN